MTAIFDPRTQTWDIANNGTVSSAIDRMSEDIVGYKIPAAFTGITLAFEVSDNDQDGTGTYQPLDWMGDPVVLTVAAGRSGSLDPSIFAGWRWIKAVSGTAEGGARSIIPKFRRYG